MLRFKPVLLRSVFMTSSFSFSSDLVVMGTKRLFDEDLQEFIKHPRHLENGNKPDLFGEEKQSLEPAQNAVIVGEVGEKDIAAQDMVEKVVETSASLPLVTGFSAREEASGPAAGFFPNFISEFYESNLPRKLPVHYDDTYSSLLECTPRKEVPIGSEHQANVPEYDSGSARNYISNNGRENVLMGICVISNQEGETMITQTDCECIDNGSITCVQQHVNEARFNVKQSIGPEKFVNLGFNNMGEEVACNWTEEEQQHFQDIIYSNPVSHGKRFWEVLSIEFPTRTKKELVSYYFNVFIYRRRAVQNRSHLLAIDSDDDEWWGTKKGSFGAIIEDDDLVVVGPFVDNGDHNHDSASEDGDIVTGVKENQVINGSSSSNIRDERVTSENAFEKSVAVYSFMSTSEPVARNSFGSKSEPVERNSFGSKSEPGEGNSFNSKSDSIAGTSFGSKSESVAETSFGSRSEPVAGTNFGSRSELIAGTSFGLKSESLAGNSFVSKSESYLHWDPPYSTMGSTKGVDLLPTCSMIEEIFGSSKTTKNT
ncbi:hypothetical protein QVD17_31785 [Tagetes erecta]|uniref:Myb-like domain-containing protein n=1 Tax=Tagetes erecta TaxID=13708 RepID=A0AAD8NP49_TARER|nr:hypothetical protein QVD17_31785 [Tagetes erecta]